MTNLIFGVGIGLFLILILWALALLVFIISLKIEKKIGTLAIFIVSICTIVLLILPRASEKSNTSDKKIHNLLQIYDHLYIWRILLLILLVISSIISLVGYVKFEITKSIRPVRITNWIF
ncbi:transmembrane protein 218-like [Bombus vosnesenskii]|uniref:Transmembrane protein 218-like n=2 Tax=Pyrobombus TaxID=144703 RepID=A0A6J3JZ32_9HYME|nr:transmembrane protein 218-like [Bombus bifarius]XP_033345410.1 transmembrane protein 218-like [Bombus vosnesenskii]